MDTYIRGESIGLKITLTLPSGTVIDLTTLQTISISVYHSRLGTSLKTGTYAGGEITYFTDGSDGILEFFIEDGLTALANPGAYDYLITVTETDTDFDDNTDTGKQTGTAFYLN